MNFNVNIWMLLGILLFICIWFFGLWKASNHLHKRVRQKAPTPRPKKPPTNWPIYQILFYLGHGVLLISLVVRLSVTPPFYSIAGMLFMIGELITMGAYWYCGFHTEIEPSLIDLTFKHELKTRQRYEDVVQQTRGAWLFENPPLIWIGLVFILTGCLVTLISTNWVHLALIAGFGLHLIIYVRAFGQISVLTFRKNNDPADILKKVTCPTLAFIGEKDLQVPAKENLAAIEAAFKAGGNTNVVVTELPNLNHLFQTAQTGSLEEYAKIEETFAPIALNLISDWIDKQLKMQN